MAYEIPVFDVGMFTTVSDLTLKQFHAVKLGSTGHIEVCGAGEASIGILKDNNLGTAAQPMASQVAVIGVHNAIYGAAVGSYLTALTPDASGHLITATVGDVVVAYALETGTTNDIKPVMVLPRMQAGTFPSGAQGEVMYKGASAWAALGVGTDHQLLMTQGAAANPKWSNVFGHYTLSIPVDLASVTGTQDILTDYTLGFIGEIVAIDVVANIPASTGGKSFNLVVDVGSTPTTGGLVALTTSALNAMGKVVAGSAITAANTFIANSTISLRAETVTAFAEGSATILVHMKPTLGGA